jgi:factor associated with neutral sphingomyelinase activation
MLQKPCTVWFSLNYGSIDNVLTQLLTVSAHQARPGVDVKPYLHSSVYIICLLSASQSSQTAQIRQACQGREAVIVLVIASDSHCELFLLHQIEQMRRHRWSAISFNRSWLEDIYEETICELPGERITPLVSNPGRVMLTSARLYFQPYNNVEVVCH